MTWDFGPGTASGFLGRHEANADSGDPDHIADLINNMIGQGVAVRFKTAGLDYCDAEAFLRQMVDWNVTANWSRAG